MAFKLRSTKKKVNAIYKTIYLSGDMFEKLDAIAKTNDTSFNNVVVSMIEYCLNEQEEEKDN